MYELKTNTAIRIPVGPLVGHSDGKTAAGALTVGDIAVQLYRIDQSGGAVTRTAIVAGSVDNPMALVNSSSDGTYDLTLTAAQLDWLGTGRINFYDLDEILVHFIDLSVVTANYYDFKYGSSPYVVDLLTAATAAVADKFLGRNVAGGIDGDRTVSEAFYALRNRHEIDSVEGDYRVYGTDDMTLSWSAAVTASPDAAPVTGLNPT